MRQTREQGMGRPERDGSHVVKVWRYVLDNLAATGDDTRHVPGVYVPGGPSTESPVAELDDASLGYLDDWVVDVTRCGEMWPITATAVYSEDPVPKLQVISMPAMVIGLTGKGFPPYIQAVNTRRAAAHIPNCEFVEIDAPDADSRVLAFHAPEVGDVLGRFFAGG
jgi:hypothetical protein